MSFFRWLNAVGEEDDERTAHEQDRRDATAYHFFCFAFGVDMLLYRPYILKQSILGGDTDIWLLFVAVGIWSTLPHLFPVRPVSAMKIRRLLVGIMAVGLPLLLVANAIFHPALLNRLSSPVRSALLPVGIVVSILFVFAMRRLTLLIKRKEQAEKHLEAIMYSDEVLDDGTMTPQS